MNKFFCRNFSKLTKRNKKQQKGKKPQEVAGHKPRDEVKKV